MYTIIERLAAVPEGPDPRLKPEVRQRVMEVLGENWVYAKPLKGRNGTGMETGSATPALPDDWGTDESGTVA